MAETVQKAKAPAKPRKTTTAAKTTTTAQATATKKTAVSKKPVVMPTPSHDQIAELARKYWADRGYTDGHQEEDWLRAEQELIGKAS
jgi:hypothetical protein